MAFAPRNLGVLICRHIFENSRPVLLVRNQEDTWSFLCDGDDHEDDDFCYVGFGHLLDRDLSLNECADLAVGHEAERKSVGANWQLAEIPAHEW